MKITLTQLSREGQLKDALHILMTTNSHNSLHSSTCLQLLQTCIANNALSEGKLLHSLIHRIGYKFDPSQHKFIQDRLIHMYANCESLSDARKVFDCMTQRDVFSWNIIISAYQRNGFPRQALALFHHMQQTAAAVQPDQFTFPSVLKACAKLGDSQQGLYIHQRLSKSGFLSDDAVVNALVDMYAKYGTVDKARQLFDKMAHRNAVSWTAMISGYAQNGHIEKARELFDKMPQRSTVLWNAMIAGYAQNGLSEKALETFKQLQLSGVKPDSVTFASILPACANMGALEEGIKVHQKVIENRFSADVVVVNALIDMYRKCGRIDKSRELFEKMHDADIVSWNAMIAGYAQNGRVEKARELFDKMPHRNAVSWITMFSGYAQNGHVERARELFDKMPKRSTVSWTAMISGYAQNGFSEKALETFKEMQLSGVKPDSVTFASILPACANMGALEEGINVHQKVIENRFSVNVMVVNALIDMYGKCGRIDKAQELFEKMHNADTVSWTAMIAGYAQNGYVEKARELFDKMPHRNAVSWNAMISGYATNGHVEKARELFDKMPKRSTVSWNAMIAGYAQNGISEKALETFKQMQLSGAKPDSVTFASILPACANMGALEEGINVHKKVIENKFSVDVVVVNALIDMYGKCGRIDKAQELFEKMHDADAVSWTAMIAGYAQNGYIEKARELFDKMPHRNAISWNAMISGYAQNGHVEKAHELFDKMPQRSTVSWNAMIAGYAQNGISEKALKIFKEMQLSGIKPDSITFASILPACANMGALEEGINVHQKVIENNFSADAVVVNALIDMYAKCGRIDKAQELFDKMHDANIVSWNAMIAGYAIHGDSKDALKLFDLMKHLGTNPDNVTFICVLFACSHAGLVDEGCKYFNSMSDSYCIIPGMNHYVCIVDLLGRAGYLEEALNFIAKMSIKPEVVVWMCLLGACRSYINVGIGRFVATILFVLEPKHAASYVLLSNIYAEVGSWDDVQRVRTLMKDRGIKKTPGCSWIEVHKRVHVFCVGDRPHPQTQEIYAKMEELSSEMKAARYIPNTIPVLHNVEVEDKELLLYQHS